MGTIKLRIAYLILAHRCPNHFGRLLRALDSPNATFFIHVDKKQSIKPFLSATKGDQLQSEVIFIKSRVQVYWGEGSMVQATLNLLTEALKKCPEGNYFCLLSGDSYPLQPPDYIEQFFLKNKGSEFISMYDLEWQHYPKFLDRVGILLITKKYRTPFITRALVKVLGREYLRVEWRSTLKGLTVYGGSQWWALSNVACRWICDFTKQNPDVVRFVLRACIPDEMFFQIIIGNSPFKNRIRPSILVRYSRGADQSDNSTTTNDTITSINCLSQFRKITRADYLIGGKNQEVLLARKFSDDSKPVTDLIDKLWLNKVGKIEEEAAVREEPIPTGQSQHPPN